MASVAAVMFAFGVGCRTLPMLAVAMLSRTALTHWRHRLLFRGTFRQGRDGSVHDRRWHDEILTGVDRRVETTLVGASPAWLTDLTTQF